MAKFDTTLIERFWSNVAITEPNFCWIWNGRLNDSGYGVFNVRNVDRSRDEKSHRLAWLFSNGAIPKGLFVCHTCDNRRCCNPSHLWVGTVYDNNKDAEIKGRTKSPPLLRGDVHGNSKVSEKDRDDIQRLGRSGVRVHELADLYNLSVGRIYVIIRGFDEPTSFGETHHNSKFTDDDVRAIRAEPEVRGSGSRLARKYRVSPSTICTIRSGRGWKHVT